MILKVPAFLLRLFRGSLAAGLLVCLAAGIYGNAWGADRIYTVKRGDTLWGLAKTHGTTVAELADRNGLSRNGHLYIGQRLKIPSPKPKSALPASVQRAIDSAPVKKAQWKYIVIHHSGVDRGDMKGMDEYHRKHRRMENGLAYHFVVGNGSGMKDGEIGVAPRWTRQLSGGHLASESQNRNALGICLVGNFDRRAPSPKQMESLRLLTEALMKRCKLNSKAVRTHQQINVIGTRCPGTKFPTSSFVRSLK